MTDMIQSYAVQAQGYLWDTNTLQWVKGTGGTSVGLDVNVTNFPASQPVTGAFYQATQPVSIAGSVPVTGTVAVSNAFGLEATQLLQATAAKQDTAQTSLSSLDTKTPALGQALAAASTPVVLTAAQLATLTPPAAITGFLTEADFDTKTGSLTETAPATDTASSGLNGRLQRIAQRLTSLISALGSPFQAGGSIGNTTFGATQATAANLNMTEASAASSLATLGAVADAAVAAGATGSLSAKLRSISRDLVANIVLAAGSAIIGKVGIDQTTPGTTNKVSLGADVVAASITGSVTANAGTNLNTSLLALEAGNLASIKAKTDNIPAQGQAAMAASLPVVLASNQPALPVVAGGASTVTDERLEVTAPGVAVQFPTVSSIEAVVSADAWNSDVVVIGDATVIATPNYRRGVPLWPGDSASFPVANLNKLYLAGRTRGDSVSYAVLA